MKKIAIIVSLAASTLIASPAFADVGGGRAEVQVGYDHVTIDFGGTDFDQGGVYYGIAAGYDFALSPTVAFGVDLEAADSTAKEQVTVAGVKERVAAGRDLYAGGRLTVAASEKLNLYAKAGYTNARSKYISETSNTKFVANRNLDGFRVGAGAQYLMSANTYVGAEYRYSNYEDDVSRNQVIATVGYKF